MNKEKIAIIDANAIVHRAFHALPPLMTKDGVLVNAVYGFANILLKVLKDIKPEYVAVCFDVSKETFRLEMYKEYKAQREKQPDELYSQIGLIKEMIKAFHMPMFAVKGYEADDLIGTIVKKTQSSKFKTQNIENVIVTGDMDTLQLIDNATKVYTLKKGIADTMIYDEAAVGERYGFGPEAMVDYKALRGDPSDNIPGVKGIGEKTATELILMFGRIEKLFQFIDETSKIKDEETRNQKLEIRGIKKNVYQKLLEHEKEAFLSKELATIKTDVEIDFDLEACRVRPFDAPRIVELFQAWNFKSLIARIPMAEKELMRGQASLFQNKKEDKEKEGGVIVEEFEIREGYVLVDSEEKLEEFVSELAKQKIFAIDTETNGLDPFQADLIGISFSWEEGKGYYLSIGKYATLRQESTPLYASLKKILADEKIKKVGHNIKFDVETLSGAGMELKGLEFDTMVASYLLNPGSRQHNLDAVAFTELGYEMTPIGYLIGKGKSQITMDQVDIKRVADYAIEDADYTWRLYKRLDKQLVKNNLRDLMDKIETPLISVLADMEENGMLVDVKFLNKMSREVGKRVAELEKEIYKMAGRKFNVRSPMQLKEILFDEMGISKLGLAKTKTGTSTAAAELDKLQGTHPIIDLILEHRELSKLKSTYTDALPEIINPKTGRIHTSFNQTVTATGRLSSSEPNLQNIPIRTELGKKIRRAFVAPEGKKIVAVDYSQIELRIAAGLSGDKKMLRAFKNGEDIHRRTAAEVFGVRPEEVIPEMRRKAKEVNFGVLYGLGARGLAQRTNTSYEEAMLFIERYFEVYSQLKEYLEETIERARESEYVETLFGRKRYLPEINAEHQQLRSAAERMAINQPIQGTAADLMKMAMNKVAAAIATESEMKEVKMILQVHDELIFETPGKIAEVVGKRIKEIMENVYKFKCPIVAEMSVGENWGECK